ncbi:MAG: glycosyltransferase, partial [Candidatus Sumerlaeota bacterium]
MGRSKIRRRKVFDAMAVIGNSLPRQCGISTFTADMAQALSENAPHATCSTIAMTDTSEGYDYPPQVRFEIAQNQLLDYRQAAEFLNVNHYDVVFLQHEFGIFGGQQGSHIIRLIDELHMPVITVLHTILKEPTPVQKDVLREVCRLSDQVVSMSRKGIDFLGQIYGVPSEKVSFVHHGIPDMPFVDPNFYKDLFGAEGRRM